MKKIIISIVVFTCCLFAGNSFFAQKLGGNGNLKEKEIAISNVNSFEINSNFNIWLFQDNDEKVVIKTDENLLDYIDVKIVGNVLTASIKKNVEITEFKAMILSISVKDVKSIKLSGASNLATRYPLNLSDLSVNISGNSTADLKMTGNLLNLVNSGAGKIILYGNANNFNLESTGSTNVYAKDFVVANADLKVSGSSEMEINVTNNLKAEISGSSVLNYLGNPTTNVSTAGSSIVKKMIK